MPTKTTPIGLLVCLFPLSIHSQVLEPGFPFKGMTVDARELGEGFPTDNLVPRGVVLPLGHRMHALFDIDLLRVAAIWRAPEEGEPFTYGSISTMSFFNTKIKAGGGTMKLTKPLGTPWIATGLVPGLQGKNPVFHDPRPPNPDAEETGRGGLEGSWWSVLRMDKGALLLYRQPEGEVEVQEEILAHAMGGKVAPVVERRIRAHGKGGTLVLGELRSPVFTDISKREVAWGNEDESTTVVVSPGEGEWDLEIVADRFVVLRFPESEPPGVQGSVFIWRGARAELGSARKMIKGAEREPRPDPGDLWPDVTTVEARKTASFPGFELEAVPLVEGRPFRPTSVGFHRADEHGNGLVATIDGDLWTVEPGKGRELAWKKVEAGLNEPHSAFLLNGNGDIRYFDRNGFTHLTRDLGTGIFRIHDGISTAFTQSADTRDFLHSAAWWERNQRWCFSKGGQQEGGRSRHAGRVFSIKDDGSGLSEIACGLRNGYIGIDPDTGEIYAVDQQGHWVPTTPVHHIRKGGYYGFHPARPHNVATPKPDNPLVYIPHRECQSAVDVVFTGRESKLGPLTDSMLVLDYFRPGLVQIFKETGAAVPLRIKFDVPLLKGAVNPNDGMLYLAGFQVWGSAAKELAGMVRMRSTGEEILHPAGAVAGHEGVVLSFNHPLAKKSAKPSRFLVQRWNYRRSKNYGSGHYKLDGSAGQEQVGVRSVHLSADRRNVFLDIPGMEPSQQLQVGYDVATKDELPMISDVVYFSPFELEPLELKALGFGDLDFAELAKIEVKEAMAAAEVEATVERGRQLYTVAGCLACHSIDGSTEGKVGPTWKGLYGMKRALQGGDEAQVDDGYLLESIWDPTAKIMKGLASRDIGMPSYRGILSNSDAASLVLYIKSLK